MKHNEKINAALKLIKETIGEVSIKEAYVIVNHLWRFHSKIRKTPLTEKEKQVYDVFMRNRIYPGTVYQWFGFFRLDKDLRRDIVNGKMHFRRAMLEQSKRKKETKELLEKQVLSEVRNVIRMLKNANAMEGMI